MHIVIVGMKKEKIQQHKESTLLCEKGIWKLKIIFFFHYLKDLKQQCYRP
jgi:hypothetical protein